MARKTLTAEEKERVAGHRARLKSQFLEGGLTGWAEHQILELILFFAIPQGDVKDLARDLVYQFGSFSGVLDAPYEALLEVKGVGSHVATLLKSYPAVGAAYVGNRDKVAMVITNAQEAFRALQSYFYGKTQELVYILCLDGKKQVLGVRQVAEGSILAADISLRRIAEETLALHATSIYLAHNHVLSELVPSRQDWESTEHMIHSLYSIGIYLEDHLVIGEGRMVSMRELGPSCKMRLSW